MIMQYFINPHRENLFFFSFLHYAPQGGQRSESAPELRCWCYWGHVNRVKGCHVLTLGRLTSARSSLFCCESLEVVQKNWEAPALPTLKYWRFSSQIKKREFHRQSVRRLQTNVTVKKRKEKKRAFNLHFEHSEFKCRMFGIMWLLAWYTTLCIRRKNQVLPMFSWTINWFARM